MTAAPLKNATRSFAAGGLAPALLGCALLGCALLGCGTPGSPALPSATQSAASPSARPTASATPATPPSSVVASGIEGRTVVGPECPVVKAGSPCPDRPLAARVAVTRAGSAVPVATAVTDPRGYFRIPLQPGSYTVHPGTLTRALYPSARPLAVTVTAGRFTVLTVTFDSGIR